MGTVDVFVEKVLQDLKKRAEEELGVATQIEDRMRTECNQGRDIRIKSAFEELKKRIAEKPNIVGSDRFGRHYVCPDCGTWLKEVVSEGNWNCPNYCRNCGKAIDWNVDDIRNESES